MKRQTLYRAAAAVGALAIAVVGWRLFEGDAEGQPLSGYIEGEPIYLAAPASGTVEALYVREGDRVQAGGQTFLIDPGVQQAQERGAAAAVEAARARADDLRKGQREQELEVFDAELAAAQAQLREAEASYARIEPLVRRGIYAPARLDRERAARDTARAQVEAVRRRRQVGALGGREDALRAADQQIVQAEGGLSEAEVRLRTLSPRAPTEARVEEIFYRQGEFAPANQPIMALLPDNEVKLRFFVPERDLARYRPGAVVRFSCDSCGPPRTARITWISPRPEFTPPILYSQGSRDRLVFMIEAAPDNPRTLQPGLPVDVERLRGLR
ncbi:HlyD family efflux transporter periplasmic adaptor subunit [soil metagenome]